MEFQVLFPHDSYQNLLRVSNLFHVFQALPITPIIFDFVHVQGPVILMKKEVLRASET